MKQWIKKTYIFYVMTTLLVAGVYCIIGRLGLFLAIPPGFATTVWPAAGIALGILLVFGNRYWIGIWLGSFSVNLWISFDATSVTAIWSSISIAALIGIGAAFQAWVGASLLRRFLPYPDPLCEFKKIFIFAFLSAPVSAFVNATWANLILWISHIITIDNLFLHWITWWVGDAIGIFIFAPLILILFEKPRSIWRDRIYSVGMPLCVFFIISIIIFIFLRESEAYEAKNQFLNKVSIVNIQFQRELDEADIMLQYIQSFFHSSDQVTRTEFHDFVSNSLKSNSSIQALSWNPLISHAERELYINNAKKSGYQHFEFKQIKNGKVVTDKVRPNYHIIYYIEPYLGNETALGFNLASDEIRMQAIQQISQTNQLVATQRITLVQTGLRQFGIILFAPIYKDKNKNQDLLGLISGAIRIRTLMNSIFLSNENKTVKDLYLGKDISVRLLDKSASKNEQILYQTEHTNHSNPVTEQFIKYISVTFHYKFGGRHWALIIAPTEKYIATLFSWKSWFILISSLLFVGLLNIFLLVISGQKIRIKSQVEKQTKILSEIAMERQLILESVGEGVIGMNFDGRIIFINSEAQKLLGYDANELINKDFHEAVHRFHKDGSLYEKETCIMHVISENQTIIRNQVDHLYCKDGSLMPIEYTKMPMIIDSKIIGVVISFRNISERERIEHNLELLDKFDELTGLPNKKSFATYLDRILLRLDETQKKMALCILCIDNFDSVYNQYGFYIANNFLRSVAQQFHRQLRETDYLAYLDGNQFVLCIEDLSNPGDIEHSLARYLKLNKINVDDNQLSLATTISIGVSWFPDHGRSRDQLMAHAHLSLCEAQKRGGNQYVIFK